MGFIRTGASDLLNMDPERANERTKKDGEYRRWSQKKISPTKRKMNLTNNDQRGRTQKEEEENKREEKGKKHALDGSGTAVTSPALTPAGTVNMSEVMGVPGGRAPAGGLIMPSASTSSGCTLPSAACCCCCCCRCLLLLLSLLSLFCFHHPPHARTHAHTRARARIHADNNTHAHKYMYGASALLLLLLRESVTRALHAAARNTPCQKATTTRIMHATHAT